MTADLRPPLAPGGGSAQGFPTMPASGQYICLDGQSSLGTSASQVNGNMRLAPFYIYSTISIARLGLEVTVVGDAGSKLRIGIYADSGSGWPGALALDAGQVAGDSATSQEIVLGSALALVPGWYWAGSATQSVSTTAPTFRAVNTDGRTLFIPFGTTIVSSGQTALGALQTGVTGALPATFTGSTAVGSPCRIFAKLA